MPVKLFDSMSAIADYAQANNPPFALPADWAGGTLAECVKRTREGDATLVAESDELLAKFEALTFLSPRKKWLSDVAGHVPNVPSFIAGLPQAMRRRAKRPNEAAPVTVLVDVGVSAWFSHREILSRGAAILALCRILTSYRAVELFVLDASKVPSKPQSCVAVRIDTMPLDLAHAAYALCGVGFTRQVTLPVQVRILGTTNIPVFKGSLSEAMSEVLVLGSAVIEVPGTSSDVTKDPARWITERIKEAAPEVLGEER
jgi:hypothetical protein